MARLSSYSPCPLPMPHTTFLLALVGQSWAGSPEEGTCACKAGFSHNQRDDDTPKGLQTSESPKLAGERPACNMH